MISWGLSSSCFSSPTSCLVLSFLFLSSSSHLSFHFLLLPRFSFSALFHFSSKWGIVFTVIFLLKFQISIHWRIQWLSICVLFSRFVLDPSCPASCSISTHKILFFHGYLTTPGEYSLTLSVLRKACYKTMHKHLIHCLEKNTAFDHPTFS